MGVLKSLPENAVHPLSRAAWRAWLQENHARTAGVWLVTFKKATGRPRLESGDAVEEALCFGWIDSKTHALDDAPSLLWFAPRKPRTVALPRSAKRGILEWITLAKRAATRADRSRRRRGWRRRTPPCQ
jgi:uncharacterized protein YdeI (YjbR/CyaY-like superfamily)